MCLPSEDEWYKAAYYKGGGTNAGYWEYATQSDNPPTRELPPGTDPVNGSANYYAGGYLDPTYYTTEVGSYTFKPSVSAYETFDQTGNLWESTEGLSGSNRILRGGSYGSIVGWLSSSFRLSYSPGEESGSHGFRVACVTEPVLLVEIDIKPGSWPNAINLGSNGVIPVAILTTESFDATSVDPSTVQLEGLGVAVRGKSEKLLANEEDVDEDGDIDLVVKIDSENLETGAWQSGLVVLTGEKYDGQAIEGWGEIVIVPPEK